MLAGDKDAHFGMPVGFREAEANKTGCFYVILAWNRLQHILNEKSKNFSLIHCTIICVFKRNVYKHMLGYTESSFGRINNKFSK